MKILKLGFCMFCFLTFPLSSFAENNFTFLFLGDLHYNTPNHSANKIVESIARDIKDKGYQVDFICHSGDLIENQKAGHPISLEEGRKQWEFAFSHVKSTFKLPFFMCPGNHDWYGDTWFGGKKNIEELLLPFLSQELKRNVKKPFYSFHWNNSYFLFLNHYGFDYGWDLEQARWLEKSLNYAERNPFIKHVFVFGHPNLWNLWYFRFNEHNLYLKTISKYKKVDAYFSGHTHYNTATVWKSGRNHGLLQITGSPLGNSKMISMDTRKLILNPPPSKRGYMRTYEGIRGYFLVSVEEEKVKVSFDMIGGEKVWEFQWEKPGAITETIEPPQREKTYLRKDDLEEILAAKLFIFPYTPEMFLPNRPELEILLNREKVGTIPRITDWLFSRANHFISINPSLIKAKNKIVIPNPHGEIFGLRDCYLWVKLKNGKEVLTNIYPYVIFSLPWRHIYVDFGLSHPTCGVLGSSIEENVPEELIKCFKPGEAVSFELEFNLKK
ncbi:MAG: metallophosphoesterase [Candidatus Ratteibacteria bacterium]